MLLAITSKYFPVAVLQTDALTKERKMEACQEFEKLLFICHLYAVRCACKNVPSLSPIVVKISIALLRYSDLIPADKAYYEAGVDARVWNIFELFVI